MSIRKYFGHLAYPHRISIVGSVLKPEAEEGVFQNRNSGFFFILVDEHSFGTKVPVFMIIKILAKKGGSRNLGLGVKFLV